MLSIRFEHLRLSLRIHGDLLRVGNEPYDQSRQPFRACAIELLADWIFPGPVAVPHRFVDDPNTASIGLAVRRGEIASLLERNPQGLKIPGTYTSKCDQRNVGNS